MLDPLADRPAAATGASPATAHAVVIRQRLVCWDPATGLPMVTTAPLVTRAQLQDLYAAAAAEPFEAADPLDPDHKYHGLPLAEVIVRKQVLIAARTGEGEVIMDRLLGRPKQTTETTKLTLTYEEALKEIERKEKVKAGGGAGGTVTEPRIVEATIVRCAAEDEGVFGARGI